MADNFENETNDLIDNAAADLINASAKEQADEIRAEAQGSMDAENSAIQQNTALLQQNAQAQKSLNEEKQKTLTIQQAIDNAVAESMRQRNEMIVYHGSGHKFNNFDNSFIGSGNDRTLNRPEEINQGRGAYLSSSKSIGAGYALAEGEGVSGRYNITTLTSEIKSYNEEIEEYENRIKENKQKLEKVNKNSDEYRSLKTSIEWDEDDVKRKYRDKEEALNKYKEITSGVNPYLYTSAIPADNGKNYFDLESNYVIKDFLAKISREDLASNFIDINGSRTGYNLFHKLKELGVNAEETLSKAGYIGNKYDSLEAGHEKGDKNYVVFNEENVRNIKVEDLLGELKGTLFNSNGQDTSLYNPVTYLDESLKSAIENSNFDGARFIFDIAEAIKNKVITGISNGITSGSFVIGPNMTAADVHKVNDFIVTDNGQIFETDIKDTIIATKNPELLGLEGGQLVKGADGSNVGILNNEDSQLLRDVLAHMKRYEEMFTPETLANHEQYQQLKGQVSDIVGKSVTTLGYAKNNGLSLWNTSMVNEVSQWKPQQDSIGSILDNVDTVAMTQHRHDMEAKRDALISGYNQSAADEVLNEFFDALDNFDKLPPLEKAKQAHDMMEIIASMGELIDMTPELQGKLEGFDKLKDTFLAHSLGGWGTRMATYNQPTIDESAFRNEDSDYWEQRRAKIRRNATYQNSSESFNHNDDFDLAASRRERITSMLPKGLNIIESAKAMEENVRLIKGYNDSLNKFTHIAQDMKHNPFASVEQLQFASNYLSKRSELGSFGSWEQAYMKDENGELVKDVNGQFIALKDRFGNAIKELVGGEGLLAQFQQQKKIIDDITLALADENKTEEEKADLINRLSESQGDYEKIVTELTSKMEKLSDDTRKQAVENNYLPTNPYNSSKYALVRDRDQQAEFRSDNPFAFSTTGMMRESFLKTVFNKSVGFRQQQGLVGFAANLGYNKSGTALSLALGTLASNVKKAGQAMLQFSKEAVVAYGELQSIKTNLGIVYGSQSEADRTFEEIAAYSVKSPFGVQTVSEYAVLLKQSGIYASDLMDTLKQIGDVAGGNQQKFANIANSFSQIEANGKATTRQLRQFATAGIPIYKELSKELGVGIEQIRKMTEQGKISSDIIEKVFANMTGPGGTFENAVNIGAKTWKARQQNLADAKQLAQANFGEMLIGMGGTGRGDSVAEWWLGFKEAFFGVINDWADFHNLTKNVADIKNQRSIVSDLQDTYNLLKANGASRDVLNDLEKQIKEAANVISPDKQRAVYEKQYNTFEQRIAGKQVYSDDEWKQIRRMAKDSKYDDTWKIVVEDGVEKLVNQFGDEIIDTTVEAFKKWSVNKSEAQYKLKNGIKASLQQETLADMQEFETLAFLSRTGTFFNTGNEKLDKATNKNADSLYTWAQRSEAARKQTAQGKLEQENEEREKWNAKKREYDEYSKYVDENGNLIKEWEGSVKEAVKIMYSGIINPLERIEFKPEKMTSAEFKFIQENLKSAIDIALKDNSTTKEQREELNSFLEKTSLSGDGLALRTDENIENLSNSLQDLLKFLRNSNGDDIVSLLSTAATKKEKTGQIGDYDTVNAKTDIYPLWQRILNQTLGVDLEHFKNKTITDGRQAVNYYDQKAQQDTIKTTLRSMMTSMTVREALTGPNGLSRLVYKTEALSTPNNSRDGTRTIDWKATYASIAQFATSLDSATSVTRTFAESVDTEVNTLKDFIAESIVMTESAANIYDPQYASFIGKYAGQLEASGINAYDLFFEEAADGTFKLKENAVAAAEELIRQKETLGQTVNALTVFKENIDETSARLAGMKNEIDVYNGKYKDTGLTNDQLLNLLNQIDELGRKDEYRGFNVREYLDKVLFGQAEEKETISGRVSDREKAYADARKDFDDKFGAGQKENENLRRNNASLLKEAEGIRKELSVYTTKAQVNQGLSAKDMSDYALKSSRLKEIEQTVSDNNKTISANNKMKFTESFDQNADSLDKLIISIYELIATIKGETEAAKNLAISKGWNSLFAESDIWNDKSEFDKQFASRDIWRTLGSAFTMRGSIPVLDGNSIYEQRALNAANMPEGTKMEDIIDRYFRNKNGEYDKDTLKKYAELTHLSKRFEKIDFSDLDNRDDQIKKLTSSMLMARNTLMEINEEMQKLGDNMKSSFSSAVMSEISKSFFTWGSSIASGADASERIGKSWKAMAANLLESIGPQMTMTGLQIAGKAALEDQWGLVFAGLTMAGVGAAGSFAAGMLSDTSDKDKQREETLRNLKNLLSEIIEQARIDAEYYEKNMRHGDALSRNEALSVSSVNDAIIAPGGKIITTAPDDYLIATKTPGSLVGGGSPVVNISIVNESGDRVQVARTEQSRDANGNIDIKAIVVATVSEAVANGDMDDAFSARESRLIGRQYI